MERSERKARVKRLKQRMGLIMKERQDDDGERSQWKTQRVKERKENV